MTELERIQKEVKRAEIKVKIKRLNKIKSAQSDFWSFCQYIDKEYFSDNKAHLIQIADIFQKVKDSYDKGISLKVAISIFPRAGKSYITTLFCAWMLGYYDTGSIMRNSYSARLAEKFSYDTRDIINNPKYKDIFPDISMSKDKTAVTGWNLSTAKQVTYFCAGVGGSITGFGCDLLSILDDPIKNIEEALSEVILDNKWNWYTSTHKSRHENNCPEIHIATRWSKKDMIGRLKELNYFDYGIDIPALIDGESSCPETISTESFIKTKNLLDEFVWDALYQQEPIDVKGLLFPIDDLNRYSLDELNKEPDSVISVTDIADEGTDYLCNPIAQIFGTKKYITDVVFTQDKVEITLGKVAQSIIDNNVVRHRCEANAGGKTYALNLRELIKEESRCFIEWKQTTSNKETRIIMRSGEIIRDFWFRNDYDPGSDYEKFMNNLTSYVAGGKNKHDDAPDGLTIMCELLGKRKRRAY